MAAVVLSQVDLKRSSRLTYMSVRRRFEPSIAERLYGYVFTQDYSISPVANHRWRIMQAQLEPMLVIPQILGSPGEPADHETAVILCVNIINGPQHSQSAYRNVDESVPLAVRPEVNGVRPFGT